MIAPTGERVDTEGLGPAFSALARRRALVVLLFALAGAAWWWSVDQMSGMDNGPWTALGALGWFLGVWIVMMAAMMLPSVSPTVALYSRMTRQRSLVLPLAFAAGYLATWAAAGLIAFGLRAAIDRWARDVLAWDHAGRWVAGATLVVAAIYQLTPFKDACLGKCRSPLGFLLGSWRDGHWGAVQMGAKNGAWCVGCCWALMAALFALGIMSVIWMAVVAGFIALEKTLPRRRFAARGTAFVLAVLGAFVIVAPSTIPGLTTPSNHPMQQMSTSNM
jgi:predicted metal-binding membrane protein